MALQSCQELGPSVLISQIERVSQEAVVIGLHEAEEISEGTDG